jgi:DNA-binding response OmpR family regulator
MPKTELTGPRPQTESAVATSPDASRERKVVLLVIEPDAEIQTLLRLALRKEYEVVAAGNEIEAIRVMDARRAEIGIILLNVTRLGGGPALTKTSRRTKLGRDVPAIGMGEQTVSDQARALWFGCDGYLPKPFYTRELRERIASCTGSADV